MPNFRIGSQIPLNDASRMPALGIGTWQLRGRACEDAVFHAIEKGYRMVDTASAYRNEAQVGKAIGKAINELGLERNDIFVITKICNDEHDDPRRALKGSLQRLGLDHVNLYLIHWPVSRSIDTWETMGEFVQEGLATYAGNLEAGRVTCERRSVFLDHEEKRSIAGDLNGKKGLQAQLG